MNIMNPSHATNGDPKVAFRSPRRNRPNLICESLEHRQLLSVDAAVTSATQVTAQPSLDVIPLVSTGPTGYSPQQIRAAYGVNAIKFSGGTVTGNGAGETIAIVDAYNDPNIASDLAKFDSQYGLSAPPSFTVKNLGGTTTNAGWALEESLDVEWAHAIAPAANIVLVEAASSNLNSLFSAVSYASKLPGVGVVSMSWGTQEFWGEARYDSIFTTPAGHTNVTYVASSGDSGAWYWADVPVGLSQRSRGRRYLADSELEWLLQLRNGLERQHGWVQRSGYELVVLRARAVVSGRRPGRCRTELRRSDDPRRLVQRQSEYRRRGL